MKTFAKLPLSLAVVAVMSAHAYAETAQTAEPSVVLEGETIVIDRQGTKVQTNVVNLREKDESTATDLRGLLKSEPAIDFGNGNGASQYISIRGMGQNSIDVKVDNAYSDSQILYHQGRFTLDPSLVKIVSVQKGAGSASAGIGATNGAIIAKTVDAKDLLQGSDKDWGVKINGGYSSNDEHSYGATAFGQVGAFDFLVSGNRVEQNDYTAGRGYKNYLGGDTVPSSALDKESYLAKAGVTLGDHRFVLSHFNDTNKGVRNVREEFDIFTPEENSRLTIDRQKPQYRELSLENTNLEYTGNNIGFIDQVTANAYVMKNKRESVDDTGSYGAVTGYNETEVKTTGANINFDSYVFGDTLVKYGVNYRKQEIEPNRHGANFVKNTEKTDTGVYVEAIHDIKDVTLTVGGRFDHFDYTALNGKEVSDGRFSPSVGVIWQATPELSLSVNHNYATRSPRLVDALLAGGSNVTIADDVKAERAKNTEIGFNYNRDNWFVNGSYYWQDIDGLLANGQAMRHDVFGNPVYGDAGIDNVGHAKNHGWELGAGYKTKNITARLGVAESNPEFFTDSDKVTIGRNGVATPISFSNKEFGARVGRTWTAGLAYRFDESNVEVGADYRVVEDAKGTHWMSDPVADNHQTERDGYQVMDVYANWKPYNNDKMNVNFAINNLTNVDYRPHTAMSLPAVGREFRVGVNYTF